MYHDVPGSVHNELFTVWDPEQGQTNTCKHKRFKLTRSLTCEIIDRDVKSIYMDCFIVEIPSDDRRALEFDFLMPTLSQFEVLCILIELVCCHSAIWSCQLRIFLIYFPRDLGHVMFFELTGFSFSREHNMRGKDRNP